MSPGSPPSSEGAPSLVRAWAELSGLWALAIAWPVYQRVASGPEAMTSLGIRRLDLIVFALILSLLVPLLLTVPELLARLFSRRAAAATHAVVLGLLAGVVVWAILWPGVLSYLLGSLTALAVAGLRLRTDFGRRFAAILSIATPVTIVLFFASYPVSAALLPGKSGAAPGETDVDTPVVLVVLDEFPVASLMDGNGHVDTRFFPNFARLERQATWYRGATSRSDHTLSALPSILTGEEPKAEPTFAEPTPPGYPAYPDSVCSVAERAGYESWSSQFVTDLCGRPESMGTRLSRLLLAGIPEHVPDSVNELVGGILNKEQMTPGRVFEKSVERIADAFGRPYGTWGNDRDKTFKEFTDGIPARPGTISLIHAALPHSDYQYLPDGTVYASRGLFDTETAGGLAGPSDPRESSKNLQQLTAQAMYVDHLVGRMIARLKREGTWDETLFALVADHGASFRPGTSRRTLSERNAGWLLPVPLFVKYPGQARGRVTDAAADIRDVTPTILDALDLEPSPRATGVSLLRKRPAPTSNIHAVTSSGAWIDIPRSRVERQLRQAIRFRDRALGSGLYALGGHAGLIGRPASRLGGGPEIPFEPLEGSGFDPDGFAAGAVPAYFQARLKGVHSDPGPLAIVVDGRVIATARAWPRDGGWMTGVNLPVDHHPETMPRVTVYRIDAQRP